MTWHRPQVVDNPITPESAGWTYTGLAIYHLQPDATIDISLVGEECAVIPLVGSVRVVANSQTFELAGRSDVFAGPTDLCYLPDRKSTRLNSSHRT